MNVMRLETVRLRTFPRWTTHWHYSEYPPDASEFELQLSGSWSPLEFMVENVALGEVCPRASHFCSIFTFVHLPWTQYSFDSNSVAKYATK